MQPAESASPVDLASPAGLSSPAGWRFPGAPTLFAALSVGMVALALSHPTVQSLAGLDILSRRSGPRVFDRAPTGTIAPTAARKTAQAQPSPARGLIGLRAAIRQQR
ncbi:MAG: hypothetical protein ACK5JM_13190 [Rhodoblastus sp.]